MKKEIMVLSLITTLLFLFGVAIFALVAREVSAQEATILYNGNGDLMPTTQGSLTFNEAGMHWDITEDGPPPNWTISAVGFYLATRGTSNSVDWRMEIRDSAGNVYPSAEGYKSIGEHFPDGAGSWAEFTFPTPVSILQATTTEDEIEIGLHSTDGGASQNYIHMGRWATSTSEWKPYANASDSTGDAGMYIIGWDGDNPLVFGNVGTRIVSQNTPANGAITDSTLVEFDFDYFYNDTTDPDLTIAGVEIIDFSNGYLYSPLEEEISASGNNNFNEFGQLESGNLHGWRAYLRNEAGTRRIYGGWQSFEVESVSAPFSSLEDDIAGGVATSGVLARFFNFETQLSQKFPFAYLYDIKDAWQGASVASGTIPSLTISTASSSLPFSAEVFSQEKIDTFLPEGARTTFRSMIAVALWLLLVSGIYASVRKQF